MMGFGGGMPSQEEMAKLAETTYRDDTVQPGTLVWDPKSLDLRFTLSDGQATVPVRW